MNTCLQCGKFTKNPKFCNQSCAASYNNQGKRRHGNAGGNCLECGIFEWNNKTISLECDHIDGDRSNNTLENAKLLCPNCHSQTSTYRIKNRDNPKGKKVREKRYRKMEHPGGIEPRAFLPTLKGPV